MFSYRINTAYTIGKVCFVIAILLLLTVLVLVAYQRGGHTTPHDLDGNGVRSGCLGGVTYYFYYRSMTTAFDRDSKIIPCEASTNGN